MPNYSWQSNPFRLKADGYSQNFCAKISRGDHLCAFSIIWNKESQVMSCVCCMEAIELFVRHPTESRMSME